MHGFADARARCSAATQHTGREAFICGLCWCLFVSVANQAARCLVCIVLDESRLPLCWCYSLTDPEAVFLSRLPQLAKSCPIWFWGDGEHRLRRTGRAHFYSIALERFFFFFSTHHHRSIWDIVIVTVVSVRFLMPVPNSHTTPLLAYQETFSMFQYIVCQMQWAKNTRMCYKGMQTRPFWPTILSSVDHVSQWRSCQESRQTAAWWNKFHITAF